MNNPLQDAFELRRGYAKRPQTDDLPIRVYVLCYGTKGRISRKDMSVCDRCKRRSKCVGYRDALDLKYLLEHPVKSGVLGKVA